MTLGAISKPLSECWVARGNGNIYVRDYSGNGPAFVLLHGFPDNSQIYDDLIPHRAAAGRRTIAFDFLGFGTSDKPADATYGFKQQLGDLEAVTEAPGAGPAFAQMTFKLFDEVAANTLRLPGFSRLDVPVQVIWGKGDAYLNVGVAENLRSQAMHAFAPYSPSGALAANRSGRGGGADNEQGLVSCRLGRTDPLTGRTHPLSQTGCGLQNPATLSMEATMSVVFSQPVRTAIGTFGGTLKDVEATELGTVAIRAAIDRSGLSVAEIETVVMGNVIQAGNKMNPARQAAVNAGLPATVPALTVNRVCGSGTQAIVSAAQEILLGNVQVALAGGMESMNQAPFLLGRGRWGYRMGDRQLHDSALRDGLNDAFSNSPSGWHTEDLVDKYKVGRDAQDLWAARSQKRFASAQAGGHFGPEIEPVEIQGRKGPTLFDRDEHNRPGTDVEGLARLRPVFRPDGTITAGNAPGLNDGAAAMVLMDENWAVQRGVRSVARLVSYGIAAVEPGMFGLAPIPAVRQALRRAAWDIGSVERFEINEAFAAIAIVVTQELGLREDIVNVEGGAVAHGHPIGATGAILTTRLIHSMRRDGLTRGVVTLCIGGGQGIALAIEVLP
jgi:acetyl-CoA C-acetyltransferase